MTDQHASRTAARRTRSTILTVLLAAGAVLIGAVGYQSLAASSPSIAPPPDDAGLIAQRTRNGLYRDEWNSVGAADGAIPDGTTVFDDAVPAVSNLDPALLSALRRAATKAADSGIEFLVNSGWRSAEYQAQLLQGAVWKYGSLEKAARWVATPGTSTHVSGNAVDIGPAEAAAWLAKHGSEYGLCQTYGNEPWHFELRPEATHGGCPPMYADPTHDPRMQR